LQKRVDLIVYKLTKNECFIDVLSHAIIFGSELVESHNIDGLHMVLELFDLLLYCVCGDFVIFNSCTDNNLKNTIGNGFFLPFCLPIKTIHFNC